MLKFTRDFNLRERKHSIFCCALLFLFIVFLPEQSVSHSQESSPLITQISVVIDGQSNGENMGQLIPVKIGDPFSLNKISSSIKQIYKTGLFSDVQVLREGKEEVRLTYVLTKRVFVRKISFHGKKGLSRKKLKEGLYALTEGISLSEEKLIKSAEELKGALSQEGYFDPEIKAFTNRDTKTSFVDVIFRIKPGKRFIIREIAFSGELVVSEDELRNEMRCKEGIEYIPSMLEKDIEKLRNIHVLLNYHRARIEVDRISIDESGRSVALLIKVTPHEKIDIVVKGARVPLSLLRPIWEERIFEEWGLAEGEAKIISYLRKKGYIFCYVKSYVNNQDEEMQVVYEVFPGERYNIQGISFEGLKYFTPSQLKDILDIKEGIPFLSWIDGERVFDLPREIEFFYKTEGFSNTQVDLNFITEGKNVKALFFIEEGRQDKIEKIGFEGLHLFSQEALLGQISSVEGRAYFQPTIQKDLEKINNFYLSQGVRGTEIKARIGELNESLYSVDFIIREGKKVSIEKIVITGNAVTTRKTIIRELRIKEGEYAYYDRIRESKRRLERLGVFSEVKMEEIFLSPEKENLIINVREGERNYASLGIGLETKNAPETLALWNNVIRPRGTAEYIRSNILGSGAQLSLVGQVSIREKRGVFSWEQPYFFGLPMQTYLNAWLESEERRSFSYNRHGLSLTTIKSASENMLFLTTLRWAATTLYDLQVEESEIGRQHSPFSATSVSWSFIWDRRSDPFNPVKGSFLSFVVEWAYPLFKIESDYFKSFIKYQHFIPVFPSVTFSSTSRLGLGGGRKSIPIHERFFAGGSNSFRGTGFDELGPKDPGSLQPIGGEAMLLLNFELSFPLFSSAKDLSGVFFYDKGNVFSKTRYFGLGSLQDAFGLGIRYSTPLGPVRFELGWNLDVPKEERKILAFITIGNVF